MGKSSNWRSRQILYDKHMCLTGNEKLFDEPDRIGDLFRAGGEHIKPDIRSESRIRTDAILGTSWAIRRG